MDPFAGSGTTAHAVLELNKLVDGCERSFIMIEKGEEKDKYASTLTRERIIRAITGNRVDKEGNVQLMEQPLNGGFIYWELEQKVDAKAILELKREELIDMVFASHWEDDRHKTSGVIERIDNKYKYLVGKNVLNEGFFIIWNGKDSIGKLDQSSYMDILKEAKQEGVKSPYHVYARIQSYQTSKVRFYQIPDKILLHLGLNEHSEFYNNKEN